jgi:hypothetical protein
MAEQTVDSGGRTAKELLETSNFFAADPQVLADPYKFYKAANSEPQ